VAQQAAELAKQFPEAKIAVEPPQEVIEGRQATPTQTEPAPLAGPLSSETEAPREAQPEVLALQGQVPRSPISLLPGMRIPGVPLASARGQR
jgi:hypothetical protein